MSVQRIRARFVIFAAAFCFVLAAPALAQFSDSYNFLKAVRDRDGDKVTQMLGGNNPTIINTRDYSSGESALHIVVKRRDDMYLRFLLGKGANPNLRDNNGNSPLMAAAQIGFPEAITTLTQAGANVNLANNGGETPLIVAVQRRDLANVRLLLAVGANPDLADHVAGMTAYDYAKRDTRSSAIVRMIEDAKKAGTKTAPVQGPRL